MSYFQNFLSCFGKFIFHFWLFLVLFYCQSVEFYQSFFKCRIDSCFIYYYIIVRMKTLLVASLLIILVSSQTPGAPQEQIKFQFGPFKFDTSVPANSVPPMQEISQNLNNQQKNQAEFPFEVNSNQANKAGGDRPYEKMNKHEKKDKRDRGINGQYQNGEQMTDEIPEEVLAMMAVIYGFAAISACCFCGVMTYFCVKKSNQRQKTRQRMQELQVMFAQSQNMNVFQMSNQPNFPRTIHI